MQKLERPKCFGHYMSNVTKCEKECDKNEQKACWEEMNNNDRKKEVNTCTLKKPHMTGDVMEKFLKRRGACETCG